MVFPLTLTLISEGFPTGKASIASGIWGGITGLAVAAVRSSGPAVVAGSTGCWIFLLHPDRLQLIPSRDNVCRNLRADALLDGPAVLWPGAEIFSGSHGGWYWPTCRWASREVIATRSAGAAPGRRFLWWERLSTSPNVVAEMFRERRLSRPPTFSASSCLAALFARYSSVSQFSSNPQGPPLCKPDFRFFP